MSDAAGASAERRGAAGLIILDRPQALNALTLPMVRLMARALDAFERDSRVERVVIASAGGRAFCAGGDIRLLYEQGKAGDHAAQLAFWREEYQLNRRIKRYAKPIVALIDGIVMGGGVGLSLHAAHRVATERCLFAMPEVGIGFFPDVGTSYALPRLASGVGALFAATGLRARAGDVVALGLTQTFAPSAAMSTLTTALTETGPTEAILARFATPPPPGELIGEAAKIRGWFASLDRRAVLDALAAASAGGSPLAGEALAAMQRTSPTSQSIALRQMALGGGLTFEDAMRLDFRIVSRICRGHDFYEGVRATLIDKGDAPLWRPGFEEPIDERAIEAYFAPLPESEELSFPEIVA
ncbi:MAG: enoyl-CoA hydratase/isomerase family protein [Bradyrhizobium sp.]|nr:MAG: enoyl-CoA hydratase/isomerase family protein [Bradyrhizobium sp.]